MRWHGFKSKTKMIETVTDFFNTITDSEKIIHIGGLTLLLIIIFAETGLMVGFFLPGDYLLFTAGLLCGTSDLNVSLILLTLSVTGAAIIGDYTGYFTGKYMGERLFKREDSLLFKKSYFEKTTFVFKKYGAAALIVGRFLPVVRTFAPIIAGATRMDFKKFSLYNFSGAILWCWSLIPLGYWFGKKIPNAVGYIEYIVLFFMIATTASLVHGYFKAKKEIKKQELINTQIKNNQTTTQQNKFVANFNSEGLPPQHT